MRRITRSLSPALSLGRATRGRSFRPPSFRYRGSPCSESNYDFFWPPLHPQSSDSSATDIPQTTHITLNTAATRQFLPKKNCLLFLTRNSPPILFGFLVTPDSKTALTAHSLKITLSCHYFGQFLCGYFTASIAIRPIHNMQA